MSPLQTTTLPRAPRALAGVLALGLALGAAPARAGEDDPIPYSDEEGPGLRELPERSDSPSKLRGDADLERRGRSTSLAHLDDPNVGLATEVLVGAMLIESSRGTWVETRVGLGGRFTWEFGRLFPDEVLREALFADLTYAYATLHDGTQQIFTTTNYHYGTLAPAYQFAFGPGSPYGIYLQAGGGAVYQLSVLRSGQLAVPVAGIKPVVQYGLGLRGAPRISEGLRISFRIELTRLRRGYMDDTFVGGSIGAAF